MSTIMYLYIKKVMKTKASKNIWEPISFKKFQNDLTTFPVPVEHREGSHQIFAQTVLREDSVLQTAKRNFYDERKNKRQKNR